ncbi:MAG: PBSX family phage terminase large subunit [Acutalibacteraceae bacterium]
MNKKKGFSPFSRKQLTALTWWHPDSPFHGCDAIICDGAVRSGKTTCMSIGFVAWSLFSFSDSNFALCGKTMTSFRRNVLVSLLPALRELGFECEEKLTKNLVEIGYGGRKNRYYIFGGRDESSASLIQGMTLGGVLLDEVALMPRSFVEQALARCSLDGAKFWFNCNPENPQHWFYKEWIMKADEKNCLYLHFLMKDNPSLSPKVIARYESLYSGAFYERFVCGKWVAADGLVYPEAANGAYTAKLPPGEPEEIFVSCDYGTVNPTSMGLWGRYADTWYRIREYYFSSRTQGFQKTDEEYYADLCALCGEYCVSAVIVDPSAASFIECIRRHGKYSVVKAQNDVLDGIRKVSDAFKNGKIRIAPVCRDALREFGLYRWDSSVSKDSPRKENDHAMDDIRYFVSTVVYGYEEDFFVMAADRSLTGHAP